MNQEKRNIVAIDVAKSTLEVRTAEEAFELPNKADGFKLLNGRLGRMAEPFVVCEASGGYERALVRALLTKGVKVAVVNPAHVRAFARSEGVRAKTDAIDAKMLMRFAQQKELRPEVPCDPVREEIVSLLDRRSQLAAAVTREKNRLEKEQPYIRELIEESIAFLQAQLKRIDERIEELVRSDERLLHPRERLTQIKGVGKLTAVTLLAYMPELALVSRNKAVALAGLAPYNCDSGTHTGRRFIQGGRAKIRRCLYMAAQTAARHNEIINQYVAGLVARGKPYKCALVAAMRKILVCMQSLLKNPDFDLA